MSNMAYCRCRNTLEALREIEEADIIPSQLSDEERRAFKRLVKLCKRIAEDYEVEIPL
jgi:signal-transduction protein with cAMP-binding, CBS, and nucleotidyltransferase domain